MITLILITIILAICGANDPEALGWLAVVLLIAALGLF